MQNVLIPCHDKCLAKYKLNVHLNVHRALSTNSRTPKSSNTTYVVLKTRFSEKWTQSESLDTTSVVSKPKIDVGSASKAKHKVSSTSKTKKQNLRDNSLSIYMKNKIRTSRIWQKLSESQPNVVWSPVNTTSNVHNSRSSEKPSGSVKKWVVKLPTCPCVGSSCVAGTVRFGNDNFAAITGYGNYIQVTIKIDVPDLTWLGIGLPKGLLSSLKDEYSRIIKNFSCSSSILNFQKTMFARFVLDNGTEFKNTTLKAHYEKLGIMQQFSNARTPQQNGVVERHHRTLVEAARTMLIFS
ncbi:retrovirus-related pol polyprotein from transposon TNT 1-94 [Tanacetum coccineum]